MWKSADSADDFPTPPWATRGLIEHILEDKATLTTMSCLEPACGAGHMAEVLKEYFQDVISSDAFEHHSDASADLNRQGWSYRT